MRKRTGLPKPIFFMSWACVGPFGAHVGPMFGPTLGHMEVLVGLCWARYSQYVGQEGFWCPTNLVSDSGHVGHNGVTFAMVRVCVRPMLGLCWAYVGVFGWLGGPMLGQIFPYLWGANVRVLVHKFGVWQWSCWAYWAMILETRFILATQMHRNVHIYVYIYQDIWILCGKT